MVILLQKTPQEPYDVFNDWAIQSTETIAVQIAPKTDTSIDLEDKFLLSSLLCLNSALLVP